MESLKMSDVFKLPMVCEDGDGFIYSNDLRHSIQFDDSDTYMMDHKKAVTHAINNHDRLVEENAELREALQSALNIKNLWLPETNMIVHTEEFCALHKMHDSFKQLLSK